ncbi:type I restriction endonuclease subunit R, EcoR124 family [Granulicatella elegans]|uniref:type I restriction endonuclease subunit R, EcoR124 family n=1 Tax=Granulicatella elegans TaxID=137732 RepID=UPI001D149EB2|nr:hypothetical protein [Granulicatella elegans]UEA31534.1 hypothetical protein LK443_00630 [Granulicatella elegans]
MPYFNIVAATSENTVVTEYEPLKARSNSYQSEAELEKEFIRMLTEQGYEYLQIHTEKDLTTNLRNQLERLNAYKFSDSEWNRFFNNSIANQNEGIIEKTRKIQEDNVQVLKRDDASPELRSKKVLIETFIAGINDVEDVMTEWHNYVAEKREEELVQIIKEEKLKELETRKFIENAFRDGEIKTTGTDIDRLMPPISRFGGGNRTTKKQGVIEKLKSFFEKFFGVGGSFTADTPKVLNYADSSSKQALMMVADDIANYD